MSSKPAEVGSVLVDVLVAIAVMAVALTAAARTVSDGGRRVAATNESRFALLEARSRLAEVGADLPLQVGVAEGDDQGFAWRVEIDAGPGLSRAAGRLFDVTVKVTGPRGLGRATLQSRRFAGA